MTYLIAGFGKFGRIAFELITENFPDSELMILESDVTRTRSLADRDSVVNQDATSFLLNEPSLENSDIVIPMVPFHLAASYVIAGMCARAVPLPQELEEQVPNPYRLDESNLFASRADFVCPDDCPEGDLCTVTGMPRSPLHAALEGIQVPGWKILVQRSFQILPGVGGYPLGDLRFLRNRLATGMNIIATACKCHGVLTGIEVA
ncbi:MAG: hypothetical protein HY912_18775 [Desulfomonile tiedjei]|uniref:Uncharacterized protein n=1 Tax=Desulfomonile tiedjei TaxID=2358 RepID=A0A9D6V4T5_9BACT|nr:hypothetical protein [Desulfomonile tiedjei]